jgi:GT2 family glycosyltransferase
MDLSIIIVNWKSLEFTKQCLRSLSRTLRDNDHEIIVVDNASEDCRSITATYPDVTLINCKENVGFARANNLGTAHSTGNKLLFLNPDTVVLDHSISRMASALDSSPYIGAVGCRLLNSDRTVQMSSVQRFPNLSNQILGIGFLKRNWPLLPLWGMQPLFAVNRRAIDEVEVVSGACLMVKRDVFELVNGFSSEYFMYAEEVDLCRKIRNAGWCVCHISEAEVIHFGGQSTRNGGTGFSDILMPESIFKFLQKFHGDVYARLYRSAMLASALGRLLLLVVTAPLLLIVRQSMRDGMLRAFQKWGRIARWAIPELPGRLRQES